MFTLKKILAPFILPPGILILFLLIVGFKAMTARSRRLGLVVIGLAALLWLFSAGPMADSLIGRLERGVSYPDDPDGDVIILLGGGVHARARDLTGTGAPGALTIERMVTAARLQRRLNLPIIISGGRLFEGGESVTGPTRRFLIDLGIAPDRLIVEERSRDTYENALYTKQICRDMGFNRPLVVTSGFHMQRALFSFEAVGMPATGIPCGLTTGPDEKRHWTDWLPHADHLSAFARGLHETFGLWYYRFRY